MFSFTWKFRNGGTHFDRAPKGSQVKDYPFRKSRQTIKTSFFAFPSFARWQERKTKKIPGRKSSAGMCSSKLDIALDSSKLG